MREHLKRVLIVAALVVFAMIATTGTAFADPPDVVGPGGDTPFLCPVVGNDRAAANNPSWITIASGYSFFPGHNQAGAHANGNALNPEGPGSSPGPGGGNFDWSPLWPAP